MSHRVLKSALLLAASMPTLVLAQQQRGAGTYEFSAVAGIKIQDASLQTFLASGPATTRFANSSNPSRIMPGIVLRMDNNFTKNLGFHIGGEATAGAGITNLTPLAGLTIGSSRYKNTSTFMTLGSQITRVAGMNERRTHPTWGLNVGFGVRRMMGENVALRFETRVASEHYQFLPDAKAAYPAIITIGLSYFSRRSR